MLLEYLKRGSYHTIFLGITSVFSRTVSFLFLPYFLSRLTLAEFGIWDFYQHFFSLGTLLLSSAAATALTRFYILYNDEPLKQKQVIGNACLVVLVLAFVLLGVSPSIFLFFRSHNIGAGYFYISVMLTSLFSLFSMVLVYLRVSEQLWRYAFVFCAQAFMATLLTVLGLKYDLGITSFFYAHGCSLLLFLPIFLWLTYRFRYYSWSLFKEQLFYSAPVLLYNFVYMGFFTIDRLLLRTTAGYEAVGAYAILWRFGALYQFFSIALVNAAPLVIFNAQKEKNSTPLIQKLLTYACLVILLGGLFSIYATRFAINSWFGADYQGVLMYVPFFFMFLCMLEVARFMQTGFHLATRTGFIPILSAVALSCQAFLLWLLSPYGIAGVCFANTCTFMLYAAISCVVSYKVYPCHIVDYKRLCILSIAFLCSVAMISFLHVSSILLLISWTVLLWFGIMTQDEKQWLKKWLSMKRVPEKYLCAYSQINVSDHEYSNNISNKHIAILGPYPPPLGGISVHIKRVGAKLQQQQNTVSFFDTIKRPYWFVHYLVQLFRFLRTSQAELVYYHTPYSFRGLYEFLFLVLMQKRLRYELILVEHDAQHFKEHAQWKQKLFSWCVRNSAKVVFIGNTPFMSYSASGIFPKQSSIESAFLPPELIEEQKIVTTYPDDLFAFIDQHYPLFLVNAFQLRLHNNTDVYGYDMCLDLLQRIKQTHPEAGLLFALATIGNEEYFTQMQQRADELGIVDRVYILHGQKELWPLYKYADVFVRPTLFDNYGISVAEALFFDIPAIASDVCVRPKGTILFSPRDKDDFYNKVAYILGSRKKENFVSYSACPTKQEKTRSREQTLREAKCESKKTKKKEDGCE